MKITINSDTKAEELEIAITCSQLTPEIDRIIAMLRMLDLQLTGQKDGETFILRSERVLYIDTVDKKTFIYTSDDVYETSLKLYELEEQLLNVGFFRANKSCIINFRHIVSLKSELDRKVLVTMRNGEKLIVSRQYAQQLKEKLEVR